MNRHVTEFTLTLEYRLEGQPHQLRSLIIPMKRTADQVGRVGQI